MTDAVQLVSIGVSAALLAAVIELVRRRALTEEYSLIWILCGCALLGLSLWRNALEIAAAALDVHYPPAVLLLVLTLFVVIVSLYFSVVASRQRQQIERLVEELALLDEDVRRMKDAINPGHISAGRGARSRARRPPGPAPAARRRP